MLTLHYSPGTASLAVHWFLIEANLSHELRRVDLDAGEQRTPAYLALNPAGVVPTLVIDGEPLPEAAAILLHLADLHPGFAPAAGARAAYYRWICFGANTLQPAFRAWFYPTEPAGDAHVDVAKDHARLKLERAWQLLDDHLEAHGPYVAGDAVTAADFLITMLMRWSRDMPRPAHTWPALAAYAARMKARPAFAELYRREGLTEWG